MRRLHLRGHPNILKRLLIQVGAFNLGLLLRRAIGVGTPRGLQGHRKGLLWPLLAFYTLLRSLWELLQPKDPNLTAPFGLIPQDGQQRRAV